MKVYVINDYKDNIEIYYNIRRGKSFSIFPIISRILLNLFFFFRLPPGFLLVVGPTEQ